MLRTHGLDVIKFRIIYIMLNAIFSLTDRFPPARLGKICHCKAAIEMKHFRKNFEISAVNMRYGKFILRLIQCYYDS